MIITSFSSLLSSLFAPEPNISKLSWMKCVGGEMLLGARCVGGQDLPHIGCCGRRYQGAWGSSCRKPDGQLWYMTLLCISFIFFSFMERWCFALTACAFHKCFANCCYTLPRPGFGYWWVMAKPQLPLGRWIFLVGETWEVGRGRFQIKKVRLLYPPEGEISLVTVVQICDVIGGS